MDGQYLSKEDKQKKERAIYYQNNKDKQKKYNKKYKENLEPLIKIIRQKNNHIRAYKKDIRKHMLKNAKARAIKNNYEFSITKEDIHIPEVCPYLGIKLISGTYKERAIGAAPTIDRIDPTKGYTPENIEVISDLANRMKQNASKEQLITFAKSILFMFDYRH